MSPFRGKAVENALVAELRALSVGGAHPHQPGAAAAPSMKALRPLLAARLDAPLSLPELAGAVQSLRYQGKLEWDRLALSASMMGCPHPHQPGAAESMLSAGETPAEGPAAIGGPTSAAGPEAFATAPSNPTAGGSGPDDDPDDYPGEVNDTADWDACPLPSLGPGKVPGGWAKAANAAGARPTPAPAHEPEVARQVREECNANADRRRRARSTGTVRQPLELRKFGLADMDLAEGVSSLIVEQPNDLMAAISRKHPALWKRVILLGRATDKRPAEALYWALERGLDELEAALTSADAA